MTPTIFVHGTWGLDDTWWRPGSAFAQEAARHGVLLPAGHRPFRWTGELGGVPLTYPPDPLARWADRSLTAWDVAGEHLALYGRVVGQGEPVHLITHSHALQIGAFACAYGLDVDVFLSISGPIRRDMQAVRRAAMERIRRWIQVADPNTDDVIRKGELFDGHLGWVYELPEPGAVNVRASYGHSGLFEERHFPAWRTLGLWQFFGEDTLVI